MQNRAIGIKDHEHWEAETSGIAESLAHFLCQIILARLVVDMDIDEIVVYYLFGKLIPIRVLK